MLNVCLLFQGLSDEEVAEAAKAAEAEAAVTSSLVQSSKADASDAQSRYYNLAHRSAADFPFLQCLPEWIQRCHLTWHPVITGTCTLMPMQGACTQVSC